MHRTLPNGCIAFGPKTNQNIGPTAFKDSFRNLSAAITLIRLCFYMLNGTYIIISICNLAGSAHKFPTYEMPLEFIIINTRRILLILQYDLSLSAYDPSNNLYVPSCMSSSFQFFAQIGGKRSYILTWLWFENLQTYTEHPAREFSVLTSDALTIFSHHTAWTARI
jgi:hypothetical protein